MTVTVPTIISTKKKEIVVATKLIIREYECKGFYESTEEDKRLPNSGHIMAKKDEHYQS